ncbi:hypothetical protein KUV80_08425 [Fictibacillus nanhaiensis]|uniref:hypothetical protein n=1 Tax=Fictibacillus nanhaiensis TaxID=742169 RepID=UPI001C946565|nr:hypothetical protein [Fictibacillus nanhaiensis]MBY6036675.1 hypothetical protein [Fictibacillus nanhaiensis]
MMWVILASVLILLLTAIVFVWHGQKEFYSDQRYVTERQKALEENYIPVIGKYKN